MFTIYNFKEELLLYNTTVDLTDITSNKTWIYILIGIIVGGIIVILAIFFIVKYIRLKKTNFNLHNEMKSIEFSNDIQKSIVSKKKTMPKIENDFETTFI